MGQVKLVYDGVKSGAWTNQHADELLAAIKRQQHDIEAYQRRHGVPRLLAFGSEREMAERFGREAELLAFQISHQMVHGSALSHTFRRVFDPATEHYRFAMQSEDDGLDAAEMAFLGRSALYSCRATCHIFGWAEPDRFDEMLDEATRLEAIDTRGQPPPAPA